MLAIQPGRLSSAQEELAPIGVGPGIGHGQNTRARVLQGKVLVRKLLAPDGLASSAVVVGEIPALRQAHSHNVSPSVTIKSW